MIDLDIFSDRYWRKFMNGQILKTFGPLLDPTMTQTSIVAQTVDPGSSVADYVIRQSDGEGGGEVLIRQAPNQLPAILKADTSLYPIDPNLVGAVAAKALDSQLGDNSVMSAQSLENFSNQNPPTSNEDLNSQIVQMASMLDGQLSSARAPNTDHGNLACAWAVNEVVKRVLGRPIGGGLSVDLMLGVLQKSHIPVVDQEQISAGNIILSPTRAGNTGHVGIVGPLSQKIENTVVYANSSSRAVWYHSFTIDSWYNYYQSRKGLDVLFFQLDVRNFQAGV